MRVTLDYHFFFFNDTATTEIYTLSLHDALPICDASTPLRCAGACRSIMAAYSVPFTRRSEEHTSELQSRLHLVCRLLLEKKKDGSDLPKAAPLLDRAKATDVGPIPYPPDIHAVA